MIPFTDPVTGLRDYRRDPVHRPAPWRWWLVLAALLALAFLQGGRC